MSDSNIVSLDRRRELKAVDQRLNGLTLVTIWERLNGDKWEHNHYEEGWNPMLTKPTPLHENHVKSWASGQWRSFPGSLEDGKLMRLGPQEETAR